MAAVGAAHAYLLQIVAIERVVITGNVRHAVGAANEAFGHIKK
ncbi:hypothetical protein R69619_00381 [Paraburkholderia nemoris]|nr:hypothetical protein [Paraburkholderia nemoris]CAE6693877.1 hypothetical protein R69619_00381 [Paraburkholderia nemoris]